MSAGSYAIVYNGIVANVVLWDGDEEVWSPPAGYLAYPITEGQCVVIGDSWVADAAT